MCATVFDLKLCRPEIQRHTSIRTKRDNRLRTDLQQNICGTGRRKEAHCQMFAEAINVLRSDEQNEHKPNAAY